MNLIGELAALATSFFFAMTALIFTSTGRVVGSQVTNRMRLTFALVYLLILNIILFREPLPFSAGSSRWIWLSLSGIIGLSLGDAFLFQSLISVGPQLGTLLLSLAPIFGIQGKCNPYAGCSDFYLDIDRLREQSYHNLYGFARKTKSAWSAGTRRARRTSPWSLGVPARGSTC